MNPLIDGFGREHHYLRMAVTDRCNLRCVYCMPASGFVWKPRAEILTLEELLAIARVLVPLGIDKIRLTGGEPTVRHDLAWLIEALAALPGLQTLAMTTNGVTLAGQAKNLRAAGLQAVNISLDTLRRARFREITQRDQLPEVLAGIEAALEAGFASVKLNVVVMAGINDDELPDFVEFARERPVNIRFIEYMPFAGNPWQREKLVPWREMQRVIAAKYALTPHATNGGGVARDYTIEGIQGTISFITPLSDEFCRSCSRLRLTADGAIKSCLLRPAEVNLRECLRAGASAAELEALIRGALAAKDFAHPALHDLNPQENRCMTAIGG